MAVFHEAFFPTPPEVIEQMIAPYVKEIDGGYRDRYRYKVIDRKGRILDPSAGKGDILDYLIENYHVEKRDCAAIEIVPELQTILNEKGYRVIDSDFLEYHEPYRFGLILMNPPFDEGAAHLLKAWEILDGGDIACVLNAETVRNPYTKERELLAELIRLHGSTQFIRQAFRQAERATDVEVVIVWLCKEKRASGFDFDPGSVETDAPINEAEFSANPLASRETLNTLVTQYQKAAQLLIDLHRLQSEYTFYTRGVTDSKLESDNSGGGRSHAHTLDEQIDELKAQFWEYVFAKTKIAQKTTSNFRRKFHEFAQETGRLAFSEANIRRILSIFFLNGEAIMQDCIVEVFDKATAYHKDNKCWPEGWDHNKSWKIAPLIIIPYGIKFEVKWGSWSSYWDGTADFYGDLDKALCYLDGRPLDEITTVNTALQRRVDVLNRSGGAARHDAKFQSTYFEIRIFKKGTVHLKFLDGLLLDEFNQRAARGKQWVGQGF